MAKPAIQARILKGFRDILPETAIPRGEMLTSVTKVFQSFGFSPIDSPALEYAEILLGKGSDETDKQMYRFEDNGKRDVALRFDLTVPLARFAAMHMPTLGTPFRRYHIAPVWRAEKPQRGRFREFVQCDFDIIGSSSVIADAEIIAVMNACLKELGVAHTIRFNHRGLLGCALEQIAASDQSVAVLRAIDKLEKAGKDAVTEELRTQAGLSEEQIQNIFNFVSLSKDSSSNKDTLSRLRKFFLDSDVTEQSEQIINQLEVLLNILAEANIDESSLHLDLSIARGLDYYTGIVFETMLTELPDIGSVCSGGRYDDLANLYTKQELPGVGASIGLDRLLAALEELELLKKKQTTAEVLVSVLDQTHAPYAAAVSAKIRAAGINVELYPQISKLGQQLKYADKKNIELVVILGEKEFTSKTCTIKSMTSGEQDTDCSVEQTIDLLRARLGHELPSSGEPHK